MRTHSSRKKKRERRERMVFKVEREIGSKMLTIETGKMARQADGSATVRYGDSIVLSTAQSADPRPGIDFFPLTVDYREKMSAAGKIPGGFFRREGRPTTKEILTCRMIDRPHRPLFPKMYKDEVQVLNLNSGARLITYVIEAEAGSGTMMLNGPAARLGVAGDKVIVLTYCAVSDEEARSHATKVVHVDEQNRLRAGS